MELNKESDSNVKIVSANEGLDTLKKLAMGKKSKLNADDARAAWRVFLVDDLNGDIVFRSALTLTTIFAKKGYLTQEDLDDFVAKSIEVVQDERREKYPQMDAKNPPEPNADNPQIIEVTRDKPKRTLGELGEILAPGQEVRMFSETFTMDSLHKYYDGIANVADNPNVKGLNKFILKALNKIADPDLMFDALVTAGQFVWKDDGGMLDPKVNVYTSKKQLEKAREERMGNTSKIKV